VRSRSISPAEPVSQLKTIPIIESGEELVDFREACPLLKIAPPFFNYRRETLVRASVARMLDEATRNLPKGIHLAIVEGWRAPLIQERMYQGACDRVRKQFPHYSEVQVRRVANTYTAPLNKKVPPPHSTGGAVDVFLVDDAGNFLNHTHPLDRHDMKGFAFASRYISEYAKRLRRILADALLPTGLTNYPSEYWHWSYGDQGWAYRGGHENAIYGPITPEGWTPDPRDIQDGPLILIE